MLFTSPFRSPRPTGVLALAALLAAAPAPAADTSQNFDDPGTAY
jgi:hypothetical protein